MRLDLCFDSLAAAEQRVRMRKRDEERNVVLLAKVSGDGSLSVHAGASSRLQWRFGNTRQSVCMS